MGVIVQTKRIALVLVNRRGARSEMISATGVCSCTCTVK